MTNAEFQANIIVKQFDYIMGKYKKMCIRKGLLPSLNEPFFTIDNKGRFIVGIKKPFNKF